MDAHVLHKEVKIMSQSILLKVIYDRASQQMHPLYASEHWDEWVAHYFIIAQAFKAECYSENLIQTAMAVEEIIRQQKKFCHIN